MDGAGKFHGARDISIVRSSGSWNLNGFRETFHSIYLHLPAHPPGRQILRPLFFDSARQPPRPSARDRVTVLRDELRYVPVAKPHMCMPASAGGAAAQDSGLLSMSAAERDCRWLEEKLAVLLGEADA